MTTTTILAAVKTALDTWATTVSGVAHLAGDPFHLFRLLADKPGKVRACILHNGEKKRGDFEEAGVCDLSFVVVVSRGKGFTLDPGASEVTGAAGGTALFTLVEGARDAVRSVQFTTGETEVTPDYIGMSLYTIPDELPVDAYKLEFSIAYQLPAAT